MSVRPDEEVEEHESSMGHDMRQIFSHVLPLVISTAGSCSFNAALLIPNSLYIRQQAFGKNPEALFAVALLHGFSYDLHISMGRAEGERGKTPWNIFW